MREYTENRRKNLLKLNYQNKWILSEYYSTFSEILYDFSPLFANMNSSDYFLNSKYFPFLFFYFTYEI